MLTGATIITAQSQNRNKGPKESIAWQRKEKAGPAFQGDCPWSMPAPAPVS
jgi:hypothetical protein